MEDCGVIRLAGEEYRIVVMKSMTKLLCFILACFLGLEAYFIYNSKVYLTAILSESMIARLCIWLGLLLVMCMILHAFSRGGMPRGRLLIQTLFFNEKPLYTSDLRSYKINIGGKVAFLRVVSIFFPILFLCFVPEEDLTMVALGAAGGFLAVSNSLCSVAIKLLHWWQARLEANYEDVDQWVDDKAYVQAQIARGTSVWERRYCCIRTPGRKQHIEKQIS
jgi:hypothetical protein